MHGVRIDIASSDFAAEQFGGGDRQDARPGSDIERLVKSASPRQAFKGKQAGPSRRVLASAKGDRRIHQNADCAPWDAPAIVRAINEEAPDPQWRKGELVIRYPIAGWQLLFGDFGENTTGRCGCECYSR